MFLTFYNFCLDTVSHCCFFFISTNARCFDKQDTEIQIQEYWHSTTHQCVLQVSGSLGITAGLTCWSPIVPQRFIAKPSNAICCNISCHIFLSPHLITNHILEVQSRCCRVDYQASALAYQLGSDMLNCHLFTRSSVVSHDLGFFSGWMHWPDEKKPDLKDLPLQCREKQINPWCSCGTCFLLSPAVNRVIARETEPVTRLTLDKVMQIRFSFRFVKVQPQLPIIA